MWEAWVQSLASEQHTFPWKCLTGGKKIRSMYWINQVKDFSDWCLDLTCELPLATGEVCRTCAMCGSPNRRERRVGCLVMASMSSNEGVSRARIEFPQVTFSVMIIAQWQHDKDRRVKSAKRIWGGGIPLNCVSWDTLLEWIFQTVSRAQLKKYWFIRLRTSCSPVACFMSPS